MPSLPPKCSSTTGLDTCARAAISSTLVPSNPFSANSWRETSSSCSRRWLAVIRARAGRLAGEVTCPSCRAGLADWVPVALAPRFHPVPSSLPQWRRAGQPIRRESAVTTARSAAVVVLAAGEGTRMRSATPKVLHTLGGRSLLGHSLAAAAELKPHRIAVVVRHGRDAVAAHIREIDPAVLVADQDEVPGTGRAVRCALAVLDGAAHADLVRHGGSVGPVDGQVDGPVVVLAADIPLLDGPTLAQLLEAHVADANAVTI